MKTILLTLFVTAFAWWAQTPSSAADTGSFAPLPTDTAQDTNRSSLLKQALQNALAGKTNSTGDLRLASSASTNTTLIPNTVAPTNTVTPTNPSAPTVLTPVQPSASPNRPALPAFPSPALPVIGPAQAKPPTDLTVTAAQAAGTNAASEEMLPAGMINFPATDLNQVLQVYGELVGRTVLRPTSLPAPTITLKTQTPLTKREAIQAFDAVLALNGIAAVNIGDKFVKVLPIGQAGNAGAAFSKEKVDQLPDIGQYVTEVIQVTNAKPTELVTALTPFASAGVANGILPIDTSQILVLRDYSENVKRMLEMVKKIDRPSQQQL